MLNTSGKHFQEKKPSSVQAQVDDPKIVILKALSGKRNYRSAGINRLSDKFV
jgi:hypothetical protein